MCELRTIDIAESREHGEPSADNDEPRLEPAIRHSKRWWARWWDRASLAVGHCLLLRSNGRDVVRFVECRALALGLGDGRGGHDGEGQRASGYGAPLTNRSRGVGADGNVTLRHDCGRSAGVGIRK
jgi:hypothetical protein